MTLPFRRRHHDAESGHDRARALMSDGLLTTLAADDAAWLGRHLDGCAECGRDWKAFRADRRLLRTLRDRPPEPPRDLWARTSAALDREAQRRGAPAAAPSGRARRGASSGWRAWPLGAAAGVLVLAIAIAGLWRGGVPPTSSPQATLPPVAVVPTAAPTGLVLPDADPVAIFRQNPSGSWELVYSDVTEVCPTSNRSCVPKPRGDVQSVDIGEPPSQIALKDDHLVIASEPKDGTGGMVLVVPVDRPGASPTPTVVVSEPPSTPSEPPSSAGTPDPAAPTPLPTPPGSIAIATGVSVVGDVAYSEDGRWLAFSARPADDSTGPDLYIWKVGERVATVVTSDHQTYFSSWHDGKVLASRVEIPGEPEASSDPAESDGPDETARPGRGNGDGNQGGKPRGSEAPSEAPATPSAAAGESAAPATMEGHPTSFLLDPQSLARVDLTTPDVWLPVIDPSGRYVAYWSGTLRSADGDTWALGSGDLVLDRWFRDGQVPAPEASRDRGSPGRNGDPGASAEPAPTAPVVGPVGPGTILVPGLKATFEASFDPDGERLAIWVGEALDEKVGRLHLLVLDPETGEITRESPLRGTPALRRFFIDKGRLAWVTPSGQDGQESAVHVLGWKGDDFGEIKTEPGSELYLP